MDDCSLYKHLGQSASSLCPTTLGPFILFHRLSWKSGSPSEGQRFPTRKTHTLQCHPLFYCAWLHNSKLINLRSDSRKANTLCWTDIIFVYGKTKTLLRNKINHSWENFNPSCVNFHLQLVQLMLWNIAISLLIVRLNTVHKPYIALWSGASELRCGICFCVVVR